MDFALSEDQRLWQESLDKAVERLCPLENVRRFAAGERALTCQLWTGLAEMGVAGLLIPEEHGGLGLGLLDAALVAEILGARVAPAPFLGSAVLAPLALMDLGPPVQ